MNRPGFIHRTAAALLVAAAAAAVHAVPIVPAIGESGPGWSLLTPAQQQALAPLQRDWATIDAPRREKWIEIAARFPRMPAEERARVQQRMAEWARMTPAQRAQARLQFQQARHVPPEERQARWQAYQALTDEERRALALTARPALRPASGADPAGKARAGVATAASAATAGAKRNLVTTAAAPPTRTIAPTVVQAKPGATTTTMSTRAAPPPHHQAGLPKIAATPGFVDPMTLLPQRGPQGAAVRAASGEPVQQP